MAFTIVGFNFNQHTKTMGRSRSVARLGALLRRATSEFNVSEATSVQSRAFSSGKSSSVIGSIRDALVRPTSGAGAFYATCSSDYRVGESGRPTRFSIALGALVGRKCGYYCHRMAMSSLDRSSRMLLVTLTTVTTTSACVVAVCISLSLGRLLSFVDA